ncbi:MAG: hypothetical protein EA397_15910 [Deltaproteobacteria bacterium]|nr:MAG: hypothetical protein EA397_15910 [Deltaproteobacteria bacterium]
MHRTLGLCLAISLTPLMACDGDNGDDTDTGSECGISVSLFPANDADDVYYRGTVQATFTPAQVPDGAELTVEGSSGAVDGSTEVVGRRLIFTPDAPLDSSSEYTSTITYDCEGTERSSSATWSTSVVGASVDLAGLQDRAYALNLNDANFIEPEGVGGLIGSFLDFDLLVGIADVDVSASTITMVGALGVEGEPGVQEPCLETIPFPAADISENPYFEVGPQQFSVSVSGNDVVIEDLFLAGSFAPDGSSIQGVELSGIIDTRPFKDLVADGGDAEDDAVCELAVTLGVDCVECPDGTGVYCIALVADRISAQALDEPLTIIDDVCEIEECLEEPECVDDSDDSTSDAR